METYLDRIKKLKSEQKLTNDQLAERSGIPLGTLSKILAGMSDSPKLSTMIALCGALGCSVEYVVNGTPENHHNYTLSAEEISVMENYRRLDHWGKSLVDTVLSKELERVGKSEEEAPMPVQSEKKSAKILTPISAVNRYAGEPKARTGKRQISLYELPVSAGSGAYLDRTDAAKITIPDSNKTAEADYALRISGNSMEPKYHNGDILLVQSTDGVEDGELGIFLLDGCGFFKQFAGDRLLSLNSEYGPILLKDFSDVRCKGRVVGRLKRR
ncbi:MAG: LexA family transcriptional regulator [Clostridia bacterium]|nr:LexA family transcriptional regulator [Clostridia bacterium]